MKATLKPCPFCGGAAKEKDGYPLALIICEDELHCGGRTMGKTLAGAIEKWNSRTAPEERHTYSEKPVAWLIVRHSGTGGASAQHLEVVLSPFTDDTYMDEGDEAWPLYSRLTPSPQSGGDRQ